MLLLDATFLLAEHVLTRLRLEYFGAIDLDTKELPWIGYNILDDRFWTSGFNELLTSGEIVADPKCISCIAPKKSYAWKPLVLRAYWFQVVVSGIYWRDAAQGPSELVPYANSRADTTTFNYAFYPYDSNVLRVQGGVFSPNGNLYITSDVRVCLTLFNDHM